MAARVITVSQNGNGDYQTPVYVPKTKNFITLAGLRPELTVLTWNNTATKIEHHQASRLIGTGTFGCGTVIVEGEDFIAENVTFENSVPEGSGQAVAIRVTCRFLGWQDTLYLHHGRRCIITGDGGSSYSYLGRPWGPFGRVVFAYTYMDQCIKHVGWNNWGKPENERNACFYEYRCYGPVCCQSKRVTWARELLDEEAEQFLMHEFIDPDPNRPWLAQRMALRIP
ncbi:hypothetical protein PTKIN_Ptkin07bG0056300 [Pterospermum kingtungense]